MSQLNLQTHDDELELVFNFYANRQYERKTGETAPLFIRSCLKNEVTTHKLLSMLECCLIKHHPKYKGARLEKYVEGYLDKRGGSFAKIAAPVIEAIMESGMFAIENKDDEDDDVEDINEDLEDEERKEVVPAEDDPTTEE